MRRRWRSCRLQPCCLTFHCLRCSAGTSCYWRPMMPSARPPGRSRQLWPQANLVDTAGAISMSVDIQPTWDQVAVTPRQPRAAAIQVEHLVKHYPDVKAVDDVSFRVEAGEVFGLLGPNGAGKTTTTEIIEGLRRPDRGTVQVLGLDGGRHAGAIKQRVGVQLQTTALYQKLTVREIIALFG